MADEDVGESWEPEPEVELPVSEQEKLKLELMKLSQLPDVSIAPKGNDPKIVEALQDITKGSPQSLQKPMVRQPTPEDKPVESQEAPEPPNAPVTMDPDTPSLNQPDYTVKPNARIRELSTDSRPGKTFSPEVERALDHVSKLYPQFSRASLAGLVQVESSGNPQSNVDAATQFKGLMQVGRGVWKAHGGGDIYDPVDNMKAGVGFMDANRKIFVNKFGREPTPADLYIMHQQGPGFFTKGTMTNIAGNLPAHARTPENMTWEGFRNWWTQRIDRAIKERGSSPTMSKVADANLPSGFLYPGAFADLGGKAITQGGTNQTPAEQAMIAQLMQGGPVAKQKGVERATREATVMPRERAQVSARVPVSREQMQVQGQLPVDPSSVTHTSPQLPIPGVTTQGEQALIDITNPSMLSTIHNYQADQQERSPASAPAIPVAELRASPPTFMDKLKAAVTNFGSTNEAGEAARNEVIKELLTKSPTPERSVRDWVDEINKVDRNLAAGLVSGVASQPGQIYSGVAGWGANMVGQLTGNDALTKWGIETQMSGATDADAWKKAYGLDPESVAGKATNFLGENLGPNAAGTAWNLGTALVGEKYLAPAAEYMGKNYPIPNLNPISPAHAANAFGVPPTVINTPAGPVVMNEADKAQFAWGGLFAVGFGSSPYVVGKAVKVIRGIKPGGLDGIFDPRREIPGVEGTQLASLPIDKLKAGSLDGGKAMMDIAQRQARYDNGVKVGIDPVAANEVLQAWRVQTNSGAQNLIGTALTEGEMNVPHYRFKVNTSIAKLVEYGKEVPHFGEYLRLRAIQDEVRVGVAANRQLPRGSNARLPEHFDDQVTGAHYNTNTLASEISNLENKFPEFTSKYMDYRDNLVETRDFISSHPTNNIENYNALTAKAIQRPSQPIFSERQNMGKLWKDIIGGKDPLAIAEQNMRHALEKQMKFDAEQRYIEMTQKSVGSKAFTPRDQKWVDTKGADAKRAGALLTRTHDGKTVHWTADPLLIDIMNSGHMPLSGLEQSFAGAKYVFQKTTTGAFAPWFAPTGMIRSMEQGWTTAPANVRNAQGGRVLPGGPLSTSYGFAAAVGARMARPAATFFRESMAGTTLAKIFTPGQGDLIARTLEKAYMDSFYRRMAVAGLFNADPIMEGKETFRSIAQNRQVHGRNPHANPIIDYMEKAIGIGKKLTYDPINNKLYKPLNGLLTEVQQSPAFGWGYKVGKTADDQNRPTVGGRPISDAELAQMIKNYTGDPSIRGYHKTKAGKPIRFASEGSLPNRNMNAFQEAGQHVRRATWPIQDAIYQKINAAAHGARSVTPWAGVLFQSPSATLAAMRDNPVRANLAFAASAVMPEMVAYMWNSYWSNQEIPLLDENGQQMIDARGKPMKIKYDYVNHMMNLRNDYNLLNNTYFAVPYKKPNEGMEFRQFQETIMNRYMTRAFAHQVMGKAYGTMGEDIRKGLNGFLGGAVVPPLPSPISAYLGAKGHIAPSGWLGSIYRARNNPYIELGGGESASELFARAVVPALTDITLQAWRAGTHSATWGDVPTNVVSQVGSRMLGKTFIAGDLTGNTPDTSGSTVHSDELWENKRIIDDLMYRFRKDEKDGAHELRGSKAGRANVEDYMPELPPGAKKNIVDRAGLPQPEPKNPLYKMLMEEMYKTFSKDEPKKGGFGWKSMWANYGAFGQLVSDMRTVDKGNDGPWVAQQLNNPERMQWLRERNVNPLDHKEVRNYYAGQRNKATLKILQTIKATEQRIGQMPNVQQHLKGKPFKINMLDPDEPGLNAERAEQAATDTE
jgi:hypothetical protein